MILTAKISSQKLHRQSKIDLPTFNHLLQDWRLLWLLLGLSSSNLLPGDKRLGGHHHHHHNEHNHHQEQQKQHHHHHQEHKHEESEHSHAAHHEELIETNQSTESRVREGKSVGSLDLSSAVLDDETGLMCVRWAGLLERIYKV